MYGAQVDAGVAALEAVLDLRAREMMQHDLHHRELVQVGVEQRRDDHRRAVDRRARRPAVIGKRRRILPVASRVRPARRVRGARLGRGRWRSSTRRAGRHALRIAMMAAVLRSRSSPCSSTASPTKTAASSPTSRSTTSASTCIGPNCFVWVALFEPTQAELDEMARGVRPARARGRGRAQRPPAAEDRGIRRLAVRRAAPGRDRQARRRHRRAARSAKSTSSSAPTTCCRCGIARSSASPPCARAPSASRSCCATARASCSTR